LIIGNYPKRRAFKMEIEAEIKRLRKKCAKLEKESRQNKMTFWIISALLVVSRVLEMVL